MRICYVANHRFPSERAHMTQIVQMCTAFVQQRHEVVLLVTDRKTSIKEDPNDFFGVTFTFPVVRLAVPDIAGRARHIPIILRPYLFFIQRLSFTCQVLMYLKKNTFTYLYGRDEWILWLVSLFTKTAIAWESHEAKYTFGARRILKKNIPIVVISEGIRDFYMRHGIRADRILVAHDAVDDRFFCHHVATSEARKMLNIKTDKPVVMYIGGLEDWKGTDTLFQTSREENRFSTYVVGGKPNELEGFRQKFPIVHFLGPRPYKDLPALQQAADILVIPNTAKIALSAEYTSPLKLFAYITSKKPIVASRIPSITNVLSEDEVFFFTADDSEALQNAIEYVIDNPAEAQRRADLAFKKSLQHTWVARARRITEHLIHNEP